MSVPSNKTMVRRYIDEAYNRGNLGIVDELVEAPQREAYRRHIQELRTAFPDLQMTIGEQVGEGELLVTRWSARGTHRGVWRGVTPTNQVMTFTGIDLERISGGRMVQGWSEDNLLEMLERATGMRRAA